MLKNASDIKLKNLSLADMLIRKLKTSQLLTDLLILFSICQLETDFKGFMNVFYVVDQSWHDGCF